MNQLHPLSRLIAGGARVPAPTAIAPLNNKTHGDIESAAGERLK